jgi:hypothetical protein
VFTQILGPYKKQVAELKDAVSALGTENAHLKAQNKETQARLEQMRGEVLRLQQVRRRVPLLIRCTSAPPLGPLGTHAARPRTPPARQLLLRAGPRAATKTPPLWPCRPARRKTARSC